MRGTFANIRIKNRLVPGVEGGTVYQPTGETHVDLRCGHEVPVADGTPLIVMAGKEYGTGSSRDWAAKGPYLLGVKAVIAESFERIHRSNLVGMGVLAAAVLARPESGDAGPDRLRDLRHRWASARICSPAASDRACHRHRRAGQGRSRCIRRIDTPVEVNYYRNGGILQTVLRHMLKRGDDKTTDDGRCRRGRISGG